jgi:uncharacterized protein with HEPN domain
MPSASRDPRIVLAEIEEAAAKILAFTHGQTRDEAFADAMRLDAILHNLHVVGEAVKSLPEEVRSRRADVPWREIAGMRDVIAHAYFALDLGIVWDAIERDVPVLLAAVRHLLQRP